MDDTKKIKYEKPEIVDFKWMEAMGACSAGSSFSGDCENGNNASGCSNGNIASTSCNGGAAF